MTVSGPHKTLLDRVNMSLQHNGLVANERGSKHKGDTPVLMREMGI